MILSNRTDIIYFIFLKLGVMIPRNIVWKTIGKIKWIHPQQLKKKACMSHIIISPSENFFFPWIKTHLYVNDVRVMMNCCKSQKQWLSSPDKSPKRVKLGCSLSMELSAANRVAGLDESTVLRNPQGLSRLWDSLQTASKPLMGIPERLNFPHAVFRHSVMSDSLRPHGLLPTIPSIPSLKGPLF